tara:strand:+ start:76 stop:366 length:291 start_codon:yes stop_codon:yes gene_type:complete
VNNLDKVAQAKQHFEWMDKAVFECGEYKCKVYLDHSKTHCFTLRVTACKNGYPVATFYLDTNANILSSRNIIGINEDGLLAIKESIKNWLNEEIEE